MESTLAVEGLMVGVLRAPTTGCFGVAVALGFLILTGGCSEDPDGGGSPDGGAPDAATPDGRAPDGGMRDAVDPPLDGGADSGDGTARPEAGPDVADAGDLDGAAREIPRLACNYDGSPDGVCGNSYLEDDGDCHRPEAYEDPELTCDGVDNDCDGVADEGCPCAYKNRAAGVCANANIGETSGECAAPADYESEESSCDRKDNDCDGTVDEAGKPKKFYRDADGDGYGDSSETTLACSVPSGWADNKKDCDDGDSSIHPGATEKCGDGVDSNCSGTSDSQDNAAENWCKNNVRYADKCGRGYDYGSNNYKICCYRQSSYRNYCRN